MLGWLLDKLKRAVVGPNPRKAPRRIAVIALLVTGALATAGAWYFSTAGLDVAGTSSIELLRPVLKVATSTWAYVAILALVTRGVILRRDEKKAEQAAEVTGFGVDTVRRLAYEAKSADGSTRVIATSEDEPEEIERRILEALETGEDDTYSLNAEAFEEPEDPIPPGTPRARDEELLGVLNALEDRADELRDELDGGLSDVLSSEIEPSRILEADGDKVAPAELLGEEGRDDVDRLEAMTDELEENLAMQGEILEELEREETVPTVDSAEEREDVPRWRRVAQRVGERAAKPAKVVGAAAGALAIWGAADLVARLVGWVFGLVGVEIASLQSAASVAWSLEGYAVAGAAGAAIVLLEWWSRRRERERQEVAEGREESPDPWLESYKLARLDMASSIDLDALVWTVAVPAGITILAILISVQLWVQPWLYPAIFAAGGLVGVLNYLRVMWMRSRKLEDVRSEREAVRWDDVAVLVKEVETPETPMFYAWLGTRRYAHENREAFAREVALRAYETVNGVQPSPSILEKQADQLEKMLPDLHAYRDDELERVMSWLLEEVRTSREGLVPKQMLIEETIEHDLNGRRIGGGSGRGFDPEIVRDAYRALVPAALVEQEIETPEGTVTAVRHRGDPLPPSYGSIRAQFSSQFSGFARWEPLYDMPDVSDQLESEPVYAGNMGYSGAD